MLPGLFGLWVDAGWCDAKTGRWVREPAAEFTCRHGCTRHAAGAVDVTQFCQAITAWHIATCPALRKGTTTNAHS
jgi:hypothetical protein